MRTVFKIQPTASDCLRALIYNQRKLLSKSRSAWRYLTFFTLSLAAWGSVGYFAFLPAGSDSSAWLFPSLGAALAISILSQIATNRAILRFAAGEIRRTQSIALEQEGIRISGTDGESFVRWQGIRTIEVTAGNLLIYLDQISFLLMPATAFVDAAERDAFVDHVLRHTGQSSPIFQPVGNTQSSVSPELAMESSGGWSNLGINLKLGLRLAFFLRPNGNGPCVSWSQFVTLILFGIGVPFVFALVRIGPNGTFASYALPAALFDLPVMIFAAWGIALLAGQPQRTLALLTVFASIAIPIDVVCLLAHTATADYQAWLPRRWNYFSYYLPPLWFASASGIAAIRVFGIVKRQWIGTCTVAALLIGLPLSEVYHGGELWTAPYDEAAEENSRRYKSLALEDTFYLQPKLLEQQLAGLKPGRKGIVDLYFVGAAGYSGQDVFMKEVRSVSALFKERFGTEGRSVLLINNAKSVAEYPIASGTSLRLTLRRIAELMDRDEDILFLFLTSHGSKDHKFSLDFWPMRFNTLDPKRLREILDESGIKRRVIVVSACYSGGFIDALKDDNSLVIAASAPDKNSFGCSNEADFTYFGKAYFDEALRQTYSFVEAFEMAKPRIAEREHKEDHDASDPRIHIGPAIREPLAALALQQAASPASTPPSESGVVRDEYDTYFDLVGLDRRVAQYRRECLREMGLMSPSVQVAKNPDAFGGVTPNSPYWPQLAASWQDYAESWCKAATGETAYRNAFRQAWQARPDKKDIQTAIDFYATPLGRRVLRVDEEVWSVANTALVDARAEFSQRIMQKLQEEQARILASYQKDVDTARRRTAKGNPGNPAQ